MSQSKFKDLPRKGEMVSYELYKIEHRIDQVQHSVRKIITSRRSSNMVVRNQYEHHIERRRKQIHAWYVHVNCLYIYLLSNTSIIFFTEQRYCQEVKAIRS